MLDDRPELKALRVAPARIPSGEPDVAPNELGIGSKINDGTLVITTSLEWNCRSGQRDKQGSSLGGDRPAPVLYWHSIQIGEQSLARNYCLAPARIVKVDLRKINSNLEDP